MYGSIFWRVTRNPRASRSAPMEAAAIPLPREETTPPVTKMNLIGTSSSFLFLGRGVPPPPPPLAGGAPPPPPPAPPPGVGRGRETRGSKVPGVSHEDQASGRSAG